jgi:hypothetical protein
VGLHMIEWLSLFSSRNALWHWPPTSIC